MPKIGLCEAAALYIDRGRCAGERHLSKRFACHSIANVGGSAEHSIANDRPRPGSAHGINIEGDRGAAGRLQIQEARRQGGPSKSWLTVIFSA